MYKYVRNLDFNTSHVSINHTQAIHRVSSSCISIHLMFLLIRIRGRVRTLIYFHFNTSHVSINLINFSLFPCLFGYFNTSHVSINPINSFVLERRINNFNTSHVSINHVLPPSKKKNVEYFNTSHVSINQTREQKSFSFTAISIHLMFLLIVPFRDLKRNHIAISIHLMFLLIRCGTIKEHLSGCYFNTSHVSINRIQRLHQDNFDYISIHLMFLLISLGQNGLPYPYAFQYISCFY